MSTAPIMFRWDGEGFVPLARFHNEANARFVVGELYRLDAVEERSIATHRHQFAFIREAWLNLPEHLAETYPTPEHLRKRSLIEAGYCTEEIIDAGTNAAALRVASFVRAHDDFAVVIVRGPAVVVRRAKSQSYRTMDRKEFAASKQAVLDIVASLTGIPAATLQREAEKAA